MANNTQSSFPIHARIAFFIPLVILLAMALVSAIAFLSIMAVGVFFWRWEGEQMLPYAAGALAVAVGAVWLSARLIKKIDHLSKAPGK